MLLRVITYNIHKCIGGLDRRYDPARIAEVIAHYKPDFALLQEVDSGAGRTKKHEQDELLGELAGLRHRTFYPNVWLRSGGSYGNAVLSQHPITECRNLNVTMKPKKRRSVLHAKVRVRQGRSSRSVHLFNLHLGLSGYERKLQLRRFLTSHPFARLHRRTPLIVAGDFNDVYATLGPKLLQPAGFRTLATAAGATFPAFAPLRALDGIYVRGSVEVVSLFRSRLPLAKHASDHLPLIADLAVT